MKRDKEWLTNQIEIMGSETSENYPHEQMVDREEVLNLIDQLDEPEKLYVVELSNDHLTNYLAYDLAYEVFFISQNQEEKLNKYKKKFTEKEIKDYDERYWPFAAEVAE